MRPLEGEAQVDEVDCDGAARASRVAAPSAALRPKANKRVLTPPGALGTEATRRHAYDLAVASLAEVGRTAAEVQLAMAAVKRKQDELESATRVVRRHSLQGSGPRTLGYPRRYPLGVFLSESTRGAAISSVPSLFRSHV